MAAGFSFPMRREKRTVFIKGRITPTLAEQLELELEQDNVLSMSTYLFQVVAKDIAARRAARMYTGLRQVKARR